MHAADVGGVTDDGPDFIAFKVTQGQWITTETYRVHLDDDADDIGEIVARALRDLERDVAAFPVVYGVADRSY